MESIDRYAYEAKCRQLGKSQTFIEKTLKYADKLTAQNLPVIFDRRHLSAYIGISVKELLVEKHRMYKSFTIRKKHGGKRNILSPREPLKTVQKWIAENILVKVPLHEAATAFCKGGSIIKNASPHVGKECVLNIDIMRFFDSIGKERVAGLFQSIGYTRTVSDALARLTTIKPSEKHHKELSTVFPGSLRNNTVLPQGAPTSPHLANLILRQLDARFNGYAEKHALKFTRYADDMTFSGPISSLPSISFLVAVVKEEGFRLNFKKLHKQERQHRQVVTGLTVNDGIKVSKKFKREIAKHLYFAKKYGVSSHLERTECNKKAYRDWLLGNILFVKSIEPETGEAMLNKFNCIEWGIQI